MGKGAALSKLNVPASKSALVMFSCKRRDASQSVLNSEAQNAVILNELVQIIPENMWDFMRANDPAAQEASSEEHIGLLHRKNMHVWVKGKCDQTRRREVKGRVGLGPTSPGCKKL
jgi:hypothetical protein